MADRKLNSPATLNVVSLVEYRTKKEPKPVPTIEIKLNPDQTVGFNYKNLSDEDAFQALIGCYVVAGKMLQILRDKQRRRSQAPAP